MTECVALKTFPFSRDGFTTETAEKGKSVDLPDAMVPGLAKEGFVEVKDAGASDENKMMGGAEENKAPTEDETNAATKARHEAIRTAISSLSDEDFTKGGKPEVDAINLLLGDRDTVTAAERDDVLEAMKADGWKVD